MSNVNERPTKDFVAVFNISLEKAYDSDPLSLARERIDFTLHNDHQIAFARAMAEADFNSAPGVLGSFRHTLLCRCSIPEAMADISLAGRWVSDRLSVLLARCGYKMGGLAHSHTAGRLHEYLNERMSAMHSDLLEHDKLEEECPEGSAFTALCMAVYARQAGHSRLDMSDRINRLAQTAEDYSQFVWDNDAVKARAGRAELDKIFLGA